MILLATNKRDITTDFVGLELKRRGVAHLRLNTEDVADLGVEMPDGDPARLKLHAGETRIDTSQITGAYYRRPGRPEAADTSSADAAYVASEWSAVLRSLWNALEGRWLNSPFAILRAEDKPRQLAIARAAGFRTPDTLITNLIDPASTFLEGGPTVAKPLRHALLDDGATGRVIFTGRITALRCKEAGSLRRAPVIFQREITKFADVRVIVVDERVFATRILSQTNSDTEVDWRRGARTDLAHQAFHLPADVTTSCINVTTALGLRFSAIDLVEDRDGAFWFLEANPNGQWAWIEQRTGAPIAAAIVDGLIK